MTGGTERERTEVALDDLRRRLYRADATEEDVRQYLAGRAAVVPAEAPPAAQERRRRRGTPVGVVAVVGALAACVAITAVLLPRPTSAPAPAATRAAEPSRVSGPTLTAVPIDGTATAAERFEGVGDGVLSIHLPSAEFGTLRAAVLVYSSRTSTISWTAMRPPSEDASVIARARVTSHVDFASPKAFTYAGGPPTRITVEAPEGLHWTMLVAAANGTSDDLR
jgi:hypothetical protein